MVHYSLIRLETSPPGGRWQTESVIEAWMWRAAFGQQELLGWGQMTRKDYSCGCSVDLLFLDRGVFFVPKRTYCLRVTTGVMIGTWLRYFRRRTIVTAAQTRLRWWSWTTSYDIHFCSSTRRRDVASPTLPGKLLIISFRITCLLVQYFSHQRGWE